MFDGSTEAHTFTGPCSDRLQSVFEELFAETDYGRAYSKKCAGTRYFSLYEPHLDGTIVYDIGCGSGDAVIELRIRGYIGKGFDWIPPQNDFCRQQDLREIDHDFYSIADTILCMDVMEHLEERDLRHVISQISKSGRRFILSISPDESTLEGTDLKKTSRSGEWWLELLVRQFKSVNIIAVPDESDRKIYICD